MAIHSGSAKSASLLALPVLIPLTAASRATAPMVVPSCGNASAGVSVQKALLPTSRHPSAANVLSIVHDVVLRVKVVALNVSSHSSSKWSTVPVAASESAHNLATDQTMLTRSASTRPSSQRLVQSSQSSASSSSGQSSSSNTASKRKRRSFHLSSLPSVSSSTSRYCSRSGCVPSSCSPATWASRSSLLAY